MNHKANYLTENRETKRTISNMSNMQVDIRSSNTRLKSKRGMINIKSERSTAEGGNEMETVGRGRVTYQSGEVGSDLTCQIRAGGEVQDCHEGSGIHPGDAVGGDQW